MTAFSRQCELRSPTGGKLLSWLPAEHAVPGRCLTLKAEDGRRLARLTVLRAYEPALPTDFVHQRARDYLRTRDNTDI